MLYPRFLIGCAASLVLGAHPLVHGQGQTPTGSLTASAARRWYVGLEGVVLANRAAQGTTSSPSLQPSSSGLGLRPALLVGRELSPRLQLETRLQLLPVASGFVYEHATATSYTALRDTHTANYLYVPVQAVVRVLGAGRRLGLSTVAGGGLAWQGTRGSLPAGAAAATSTTSTSPSGLVSAASYTQRVLQEKTAFGVLEVGLRGTWQLAPSLALHLTVRQLWGVPGSVQDLEITVTSPDEQAGATFRTPVSGLATGLSLCYGF